MNQGCLISSLGYVGVRSAKLDEWKAFAADILGMQVDASEGGLRLRMDDKLFRYDIQRSDGPSLGYFGFEVADELALQRLGELLSKAGHSVSEGSREECTSRGVDGLLWLLDPDGHRVEFFHGARQASDDFIPGKPIGGFRTAELGMGHLVLYTPRFAAMSEFYQSLLGFRLTDYHHEPFEIEFLRVNPRHHSLGLIADPGAPRVHHAMVEYLAWDDVGRAYDLALADPERIAVSLGRHLNDHMTSFYMWTPDAFFVEIGWAGRSIDEATWQVTSLDAPSLWGHVRYWQTPEKRTQTKNLVQALGRRGVRAPVVPPDEAAPTGTSPDEKPRKGE